MPLRRTSGTISNVGAMATGMATDLATGPEWKSTRNDARIHAIDQTGRPDSHVVVDHVTVRFSHGAGHARSSATEVDPKLSHRVTA